MNWSDIVSCSFQGVLVLFTGVLVFVYVRRQTKVMNNQMKSSEYSALAAKCVGYMSLYEAIMRKDKEDRSAYEQIACRKIEDTILRTMDALEELELDIGVLRKQTLDHDSHF